MIPSDHYFGIFWVETTKQINKNHAGCLETASFFQVPREEIFLTTKIWSDDFGWEKALTL